MQYAFFKKGFNKKTILLHRDSMLAHIKDYFADNANKPSATLTGARHRETCSHHSRLVHVTSDEE